MPTFTDGGAVLVEDGLRFDLVRVLEAMIAVVDACARAFGDPIIRTVHAAYPDRLSWNEGGRDVFRRTWIEAGKIYDAVDEPMVAVFPNACLKLYPLGATHCLERGGQLRTPSGGSIERLDPTPRIRIYGKERDLRWFDFPTPEMAARLETLLSGQLVPLRLGFQASQPFAVSTDPKALGVFASIAFPHAAYGAGRGPIRVRCLRHGLA